MDTEFGYVDINTFISATNRSTDITVTLHHLTLLTRLKNGKSTAKLSCFRSIDNYKEALDKITKYLHSREYKMFHSYERWYAIRDYDNTYVMSLLTIGIEDNTLTVRMEGDLSEISEINKWVMESFIETGVNISTATHIDARGILKFDPKYMTEQTSNIAKQSFYPWLTINLEEYFKLFMESDETVLVLFGPPGTGKSTFLRSLIMSGRYPTYLAYNKQVVELQIPYI